MDERTAYRVWLVLIVAMWVACLVWLYIFHHKAPDMVNVIVEILGFYCYVWSLIISCTVKITSDNDEGLLLLEHQGAMANRKERFAYGGIIKVGPEIELKNMIIEDRPIIRPMSEPRKRG